MPRPFKKTDGASIFCLRAAQPLVRADDHENTDGKQYQTDRRTGKCIRKLPQARLEITSERREHSGLQRQHGDERGGKAEGFDGNEDRTVHFPRFDHIDDGACQTVEIVQGHGVNERPVIDKALSFTDDEEDNSQQRHSHDNEQRAAEPVSPEFMAAARPFIGQCRKPAATAQKQKPCDTQNSVVSCERQAMRR